MAFINQENKFPQQQDPAYRGRGRGFLNSEDHDKALKKAQEQKAYKEELQRQMKEHEERKRKEQEKIRKEDEKFMKELEQINKKQANVDKEKLKNSHSTHPLQQEPKSTQNIHFPEPQKVSLQPDKPSLFDQGPNQKPNSVGSSSEPRIKYIFDESPHSANFYQEKMRKNKQSLNKKMQELMSHIHGTKDHIRPEEEIEKIREQLRKKKTETHSSKEFKNLNHSVDEYSHFYQIPKKSVEIGLITSKDRKKSEKMEYKRQQLGSFAPTTKMTANYDLSEGQNYGSRQKNSHSNILGNRPALDFQIEKTIGGIDDYLHHLNDRVEEK